jgi:hypothetical protein
MTVINRTWNLYNKNNIFGSVNTFVCYHSNFKGKLLNSEWKQETYVGSTTGTCNRKSQNPCCWRQSRIRYRPFRSYRQKWRLRPRYRILATIGTKMGVFWDVAPCSWMMEQYLWNVDMPEDIFNVRHPLIDKFCANLKTYATKKIGIAN